MLPNQRCTCLARAFMPSQTPAAALLHHAHSVMTGNNTYFWPKTESREKCYLSSFPWRSEDASSLTASSFSICYWYFGTFKTWIATCIPVPAESSPFERSFFYLSRTNAEETVFPSFSPRLECPDICYNTPHFIPIRIIPASFQLREVCNMSMSSFGEPETR